MGENVLTLETLYKALASFGRCARPGKPLIFVPPYVVTLEDFRKHVLDATEQDFHEYMNRRAEVLHG